MEEQRQNRVQNDPFGPSYPESAARFMLYRIGLVLIAIALIILGKSNLPQDGVKCIEDVVLETIQPVSNFFIRNEVFGRTLLTTVQLIVDLELVGMLTYWYLYGDSFRYPLCLAILGLSKVLVNFLFRTVTIEDSFLAGGYIPSLVFGSNFQNAYFFSGTSALMVYHLCELVELGKSLLWKIQAGITLLIVLMLLLFRLNFFMDVITGLVFGHLIFRNVVQHQNKINQTILGGYSWTLKKLGSVQPTEQSQELSEK